MRIVDLIDKLTVLLNTYDAEYYKTMGAPEIVIDVFKLENNNHVYAGFSQDFPIGKTADGIYDIISAFAEDHSTEWSRGHLEGAPPWWGVAKR